VCDILDEEGGTTRGNASCAFHRYGWTDARLGENKDGMVGVNRGYKVKDVKGTVK